MCITPGCSHPVHGHGYCSKHYQRWKKHGDPHVNFYARPIPDRFFSKLDKYCPAIHPTLGACWLWTAALDKDGYGRFTIKRGVMVMAHRFSFEAAYGPSDHSLEIDHLCRMRACVNPVHLELVTTQENTRRRIVRPTQEKVSTYSELWWQHLRNLCCEEKRQVPGALLP
jgi:hypothetical protein